VAETRTLAGDLAVADAGDDELYGAMDWLLARQGAIECKRTARHSPRAAWHSTI